MKNVIAVGYIYSPTKATSLTSKEESTMTTTELSTTLRNLKDLMNMMEKLEAEIAAAQDTIKVEMTAR
jgi:hypothetical protein